MNPLDWRTGLLPAAMALALATLSLRLWHFQVVSSGPLRARAEASRYRRAETLAPRGAVTDRNGRAIAITGASLVATLVPQEFDEEDGDEERLRVALGVPSPIWRTRLKEARARPYEPAVLRKDVPIALASRLVEESYRWPGLRISDEPLRRTPDATSFTHVLGYVGAPTEADERRIAEEDREPARLVGKSGLERAYDARLSGVPGEVREEVDRKGRPIRPAGERPARPGDTLVTTLDGRLQKLATRMMNGRGFRGAIVALDPRDGSVLCSVSSPTYVGTIFDGGLTGREWDRLTTHPGKPMLDRAIGAAHSPGSTFKMVTALAAHRAGGFDPKARVFCGGAFHLGRARFGCLGHHGPVDLDGAMAVSCNVYFMTLGHRAGRERIAAAARELGLGERTGIELAGETAGTLPDDRWRVRARGEAGGWLPGDAVNASIGQGAVSVSALQMALATGIVARRGQSFVPHLVKEWRSPTGVEPFVPVSRPRVEADAAFWTALRGAMEGVVTRGTARGLAIPGLRWAAKTGSAEHSGGGLSHSWFVAYAPADDPKIAVCGMAEAAGHGSTAAGPVVKALLEAYLMPSAKAAVSSAVPPPRRSRTSRPSSALRRSSSGDSPAYPPSAAIRRTSGPVVRT